MLSKLRTLDIILGTYIRLMQWKSIQIHFWDNVNNWI
jgi:hypothetical protein